jgi:hypothetical protein
VIVDFISDSTLRAAAKTLDVEPPVRETMQHADKFNADQFGSIVGNGGSHNVIPARERRANYVGAQTVHQYTTSPK